jgi:hypothetical protein
MAGGGIVEPFPRQTLVGVAGGPTTYYSAFYDSTDWKTVAWWLHCYGSIPGVVGSPITMYIDTGEGSNGPFDQLVTQMAGPTNVFTGGFSNPGSIVQARIVLIAGEISNVALRFHWTPK